MILLFLIITLAIGLVITALIISSATISEKMMVISLSIGTGIGITSFVFLLFTLALNGMERWFLLFDLILLSLGILGLASKKTITTNTTRRNLPKNESSKTQRIFLYLLIGCLIAGLIYFLLQSIAHPHGEWDGWAIWNLHARFLFWGGERWKNMYTPELDWTRPDYPLLLPIAIARGWEYLSFSSVLIPILLAFLFTIGTIALLVSCISVLTTKMQGALSGFVLLGTPYFLTVGTNQYADTPFGYYLLATLALVTLHDKTKTSSAYIFFAGVTTGFALSTKNEGYLLLIVILLSRYAIPYLLKSGKRLNKELALYLVGFVPFLLSNLYIKYFLSPPNYLLRPSTIHNAFSYILDGSRYVLVAKAFFANMLIFGNFSVAIPFFLVLYALMVGVTRKPKARKGAYLSFVVVTGMLLGYFAIYIITPYDLSWQLSSSLQRLYIQLWPSVLFGFFLFIAPPEEATSVRREGALSILKRQKNQLTATKSLKKQ